MSVLEAALKLLGLSEVLLKWQGPLRELSAARRERVAAYAGEIAACIGRAAAAAEQLGEPNLDKRARRKLVGEIVREVGRLRGYVEDVAETLKNHLDGRKLSGVKRRLQSLEISPGELEKDGADTRTLVDRFIEAEGYMRALIDRLKS
ncbi:MAG: hypothetical protein F9K44_16680 [Hyphomicrobiaceae bacterium]|nr:MAG: hypothetical protein F9K44_16680 [Hyphomicrobiaceae bacterium]